MSRNKQAFTLIELLVVIIIIGILTAVAVPQYQLAVDKSRFSSLQPVSKKVQEAQEHYYLSNGKYASELNRLDIDIAGTMDSSGVSVTSSDGVIVSILDEEGYNAVIGSRDDVHNRYVAYQVHSENFGGNIHCEAKNESERSKKLCESIGGEYVGENGEWLAYRLAGMGNGTFPTTVGKLDTSNIQNWKVEDFISFAASDLRDIWLNCQKSISCFQNEVAGLLCTNNGSGKCLDASESSITTADGNKYYWGITNDGAAVLYINDYAARPFFAEIYFGAVRWITSEGSIRGNMNHNGQAVVDWCRQKDPTYTPIGDWVGCAL
ncbi:MAG: prepilin-type N-terminal cleavage/methylation domain-containing protein [Elusimicrobiaceae bacterium]|nr:prepilin-type N-terminal cleavage/methylation domain-containing protein [Elusimicrobiaceae bacterium]